MNNTRLIVPAALAVLLSACGGSGTDGSPPPTTNSPTDLTAAGKVTGFGSIYVNGIEFETGSATYNVDDQQGSGDSSLSVGMFVKVKGSVNADGVTGTAESVSYDDDFEGPVTNLRPYPTPTDVDKKIFDIFTHDIVIDRSTTIFEAEDGSVFEFDTIAEDDNVEVSGEYHGDVFMASYVELQDALDDDYEVEGTITAVAPDGSTFTLTLANGTELNVMLAIRVDIPSAGIMVDQFVEVEGTTPDPADPAFAGIDLLATKVELEDEGYYDDTDGEVEIKGELNYDMATDTWTIIDPRTVVVFDDSTEYEPASLGDAIADGTASGRVVEIEGHIVNGELLAEEVEDEEDDLEFKAVFESTPSLSADGKSGTITVIFPGTMGGKDGQGRLDIIVDGGTWYMDDDAIERFTLGDLVPGTVIEVHAHVNAANEIVASTLEVEDGMEVEIEGPVDVDGIGPTFISVLTIEFGVDAALTTFVNGMPVAGDYVSVTDTDADGLADFVEIED